VAVELIEASGTKRAHHGPGSGRLRLSRCGAHTVLERAYATSPLKIFNTRGVGTTCWLSSATLGGGLVGGDVVDLSLELGRDTRAVLTTQASTKVYRSCRPSRQTLSATIENDALLAVVPDPIVCFAHAHFTELQKFELGETANLVVVDWITSGRHAVGERWAFRHYESRIEIQRAGRRILHDAILLTDDDGPVGERLRSCNVLLTAVMIGPMLVAHANAAVERCNNDFALEPGLVCAAWPLVGDGALIRIAGSRLEHVAEIVHQQFRFLGEVLGDDPWTRKW
jgi:urease accessory protein